jgi:hypothetical protein
MECEFEQQLVEATVNVVLRDAGSKPASQGLVAGGRRARSCKQTAYVV